MESRSQVAAHMEPWRSLRDKVVMVTGASSGLGREFCLDLAKAGCRIIAAARRIDRLQSLCDEINGAGSGSGEPNSSRQLTAVAVELDVSANGPAIEAAVQRAWDAFGRIDALINNAGVRGNFPDRHSVSKVLFAGTSLTFLMNSIIGIIVGFRRVLIREWLYGLLGID